MRDYVHEHFAKFPSGSVPRPLLVCEDGFSLSVQGSDGHYSSPRTNNAAHYHAVEVLVDRRHPTLGRTEKHPDGMFLYGWVPTEKVNRIIHRHGGLAA